MFKKIIWKEDKTTPVEQDKSVLFLELLCSFNFALMFRMFQTFSKYNKKNMKL